VPKWKKGHLVTVLRNAQPRSIRDSPPSLFLSPPADHGQRDVQFSDEGWTDQADGLSFFSFPFFSDWRGGVFACSGVRETGSANPGGPSFSPLPPFHSPGHPNAECPADAGDARFFRVMGRGRTPLFPFSPSFLSFPPLFPGEYRLGSPGFRKVAVLIQFGQAFPFLPPLFRCLWGDVKTC